MQPTSRLQQLLANKKLVLLCVIALIIIGLILIPNVQKQTGFNVSSTSPKLGNMATISPYLKVNFTRQLSDKNIKYTSSNNSIKSIKVTDKTLQLNFKGNKFEAGKKYSITIQSISSKEGETITDYKLEFKTVERRFESLTDEEQKAVIAAQDTFDYSPESITFNGLDDLLDHGPSWYQVNGLKEALYRYSKSTGKNYQNITLVQTTIEEAGVVPDSGRSTLYFSVAFNDDQTLKAQLDTFDSTAIQLYLSDLQSGQKVYDSGTIDTFEQ